MRVTVMEYSDEYPNAPVDVRVTEFGDRESATLYVRSLGGRYAGTNVSESPVGIEVVAFLPDPTA